MLHILEMIGSGILALSVMYLVIQHASNGAGFN
jgi:hypothetical protein